jgi:hypothetical protein
MVGSPELELQLFVDVGIECFPEHFPVCKLLQLVSNLRLEVSLQVGFQQVEVDDHVDDGEGGHHHRTQEVQNDGVGCDAVVEEDSAFIIGDPVNKNDKGLIEAGKEKHDVIHNQFKHFTLFFNNLLFVQFLMVVLFGLVFMVL